MTDTSRQSSPAALFDHNLLRMRRQRFAAGFSAHDFMQAQAADIIKDRISDIRRSFPAIALIGDPGGHLKMQLASGWQGNGTVQSLDIIEAGAADCAPEPLMLEPASCDMIASNLTLQWINDLPGMLMQINQALKPDALFIGSMLGGDSLIELRHSLMTAEAAIYGGASPRTHPTISVQDATGLLQRAGFVMPVVDFERITVDYGSFGALLEDLRAQGGNILTHRRRTPLSRAFWAAAAEEYHRQFSEKSGRLLATLDIIFCTGWRAA